MIDRRGAVLPIVVICGVLLAGMVVAFQFISASDYKLSARIVQEAQARALADLAFDEVWHGVYEIQTLPGSPKPAWMDELFDLLETKRKGAGTADTLDARVTKSFNIANDLPVTLAASKKATEIADLKSVDAHIGPFKVDGGPFAGDKKIHYQEDVFEDAKKDNRPWDLRGPLTLEIKIKGDRSPIAFSQTYERGQTLMFTDTTPVARDFCMFTYAPPPTLNYAVNDLNDPASAGFLNVYPQHDKGRLMFRGPLLIVPEEAPLGPYPKPYLGDKAPQPNGSRQPMNYPDGKFAPELAMIPGPRELEHPDAQTGTLTGLVSSIIPDMLEGVLAGVEVRRPARDESHSALRTKKYVFTVRDLTICGSKFDINSRVPKLNLDMNHLSLVLQRGAGTGDAAVYQSLDLDKASYYPAMGFAFGLKPQGTQRLIIKEDVPSIGNFGNSFQGVYVPFKDGGPPIQRFTQALGRQAGTDPTARLEGDIITTEPVLRSDGKNQNVGLMGLYGVAHFESKTYLSIPILKLSEWLIDIAIEKTPDAPTPEQSGQFLEDNGILKAIAIFFACGLSKPSPKKILQDNRATLAQQALTNLQMDPATQFLIRRYHTEGPTSFNFPTTETDLTTLVRDRKGLIVPFGAYTHEQNFWQSAQMAPSKAAVIESLTKKDTAITADDDTILRELLREPAFDRPPNIAAVDPNWDVDKMPTNMSAGLDAALKAVCETYAGRLNRFNDAEGKAPGAVVTELFGKARTQAWALPLNLAEKLRPKGAFLPDQLPPAVALDVDLLARDYPRGFFPPKYRDFLRVATRQYDTLEEYAQVEGVPGAGGTVLPLKGIVYIKKLNFAGGLTYRGRGIILTYTANGQPAPSLTGNVRPESPNAGSHLTLVHRMDPEFLKTADAPLPVMELGPQFEGTVVADAGVKPGSAAGNLVIKGNLVVGLINKAKQGAGNVDVIYDPEIQKPASPTDGMKPLWTPELNGTATSINPGS